MALSGKEEKNGFGTESGPDSIELFRILALLRANMVTIVAFCIVFAIAAAGASLLIPNYYVATTQVLLDPEGSRVIESDLAVPNRAADAHALNQQYIITSSRVLARVVEDEKLFDDPKFGAASPYYDDKEQRSKLALDKLRKAIRAELSKSSFVVTLSVTADDPDKAARIANAITATYGQVRVEMNSGVVRKASDGLAAQLSALQKAVEDADRAVQDYKASNNLLDIEGRPGLEKQIGEINTEVSKLLASIADNEALVSELKRAQQDREHFRSVSDIYLTPAIILLRDRYYEALQEQTVLAASLGNRHPSFLAAQMRTQAQARNFDEQLRSFATSTARNGEKLKAQLALLQSNADSLKGRLNGDDQSMVRLRELERKLDSDRLVYEAFLLRTRQLSEQESTTSENPQIISTAQPPLRKAGPPRALLTIGGALFGLILGGGFVILRDQFSHMPKTAPRSRVVETEKLTRPKTTRTAGSRFFSRRKDEIEVPSGGSEQRAVNLLAGDEAAYADLARSLLGLGPAGGNYCALVVSAGTASLSENIAFNLAFAATQLGCHVLLVDAAISDPVLSRALDLEKHEGLSGAMAMEHIDGSSLVTFDFEPRLTFLPAGKQGMAAPARGARATTLSNWLLEANCRYDLVIVDGGVATGSGAPRQVEAAASQVIMFKHNDDGKSAGGALTALLKRGLAPVRMVSMNQAGAHFVGGNAS
ncbi:exopolysaccharide transport family protein [Rhizobium sp. LjRoot30]|uniref:GumC family protein n=1 Tax=Rhizobium sp. LjRoot30 TaxID=3342320 RepID=UPI003ECFA7C6